MRILFLILFSLLWNARIVDAAVSYSCSSETIIERKLPIERKYKKLRKRKRIRKAKPNRMKSSKVGLVYMIIGISIASVALLIGLMMFILLSPTSWVLFLIPILFFITGVSMVISGAVYRGRNKDWDIDYR